MDVDFDWEALEALVGVRAEETKRAMKAADEEATREALDSAVVQPAAQPKTTPATQVSEEDLKVCFNHFGCYIVLTSCYRHLQGFLLQMKN